jgi:hypothetical protein
MFKLSAMLGSCRWFLGGEFAVFGRENSRVDRELVGVLS